MRRKQFIQRALCMAGLAVFAALGAGCSSQQVYGAGQAMRRNQCYQLAQMEDRQRCLKEVDPPYDSYQKEAGSLSTGNRPAAPDPAN